jgi:hypothetical protein
MPQAKSGYAVRWTTEGTSGETTVTEAEWLACTDPVAMLEFLRDKASDRKLRLFACAYCRAVRESQHMLPGTAVAVAERYADGLASDEDLASERRGVPFPNEYSEWVVGLSAYDGAWQSVDWLTSARDLMKIDPDALRHFPIPLDDIVKRSVFLLRDIFGSLPFRHVTLSPAVLTWNSAVVVRLAQAVYEDRHLPEGTLYNTRLLILADALEEAGCLDADILGHLRGPRPHVRGCWAVDLCLGKS